MNSDELLTVVQNSIPGIHWRDATYPPEESRGAVISAEVAPCLTLICWQNADGEYVVIATNPTHEIIGKGVRANITDALTSAILDGCIWLSQQAASIIDLLSVKKPALETIVA